MEKDELLKFLKENLIIDIDSEYIEENCKAIYVTVLIGEEKITTGVGYV